MKYQHILFDLDGTLTNPAIGITSSVMYALKKFGVEPPDRSELYCCIGPPLVNSFKELWGFDDEKAWLAVEYYREYFGDKGIFENEVYEGIPELLAALKAVGKKVYLATSKPEEYAVEILKHFDLYKYFDFIAANTMAEDRATKKEVIDYLKSSIPEVNSDNAVMVGDTVFDAEGARLSQLDSVCVLYGFGKKDELLAAGAGRVAESVCELRKILLEEQ
ncbi:MAG: HAD hydrolase-like protein [Oscillospiraceae bacterium]|nr:HAD hydrolase-like protein [Oscillospiraceae bacterium]